MASHRFKIGDHLSSPRTLYTHHGIYLGRDSVIHYAGFASEMSSGAIEITSLDDFMQGQGARVIPHPNRKWDVEKTLERAYGRLGEDWYNLLCNNCEHFVYWCIEGKQKSYQVDMYKGYVIDALTYAALKRQAPEVLAVLMQRYGLGIAAKPVSTAVASSLISSSFAPSLAPAVVKAVSSGAMGAGAASTLGYGGAGAIAGFVGITAPVSLPTVLVAGAAVGIGTYLYDRIFG